MAKAAGKGGGERRRTARPAKAARTQKTPVKAARAAKAPAKVPSEPRRKAGRPPRMQPEARRQAILDAALTVFADNGFAAARLDDVAARAGVAKGTLYLYFSDKEALFEELIRSAVRPILNHAGDVAALPDASAEDVLEAFFTLFVKEVLGTRRKLLLRLILAEGPRFPAIAEFYYREVVSRGLDLMRAVAERAAKRGEFPTDAPARYPQLIVAPLLVAVLWDGLFAKIEPLDVADFLRAHRELLTGKTRRAKS